MKLYYNQPSVEEWKWKKIIKKKSTLVNLPNSWPSSWDRDNFIESKHKKIFDSTRVNLLNSWSRSWDYDNFIESKSKQIMKPKSIVEW